MDEFQPTPEVQLIVLLTDSKALNIDLRTARMVLVKIEDESRRCSWRRAGSQ